MIRNGVKYVSLIAGFAALNILLNAAIHRGYPLPAPNPLYGNQYLVDDRMLTRREWRDFSRRPDVLILSIFFFVTAGPTVTLPVDFNVNANTINAIGAGAGGAGGISASNVFTSGNGGPGGGGGAFAQISNYSGHIGGQVVNCQVGTSDTWFDSTSILFAQGAIGRPGGQAASSVGTVVFSGGDGGHRGNGITTGFPGGGGGGGGGGAAGPHGTGNNGGDGGNGAANSPGSAGGGATGDAGNTPADSNGTQFDATHGSGGGGDGAAGGNPTGNINGLNALSGGSYGAGGGGGGGGGSDGTNLGTGGTGGNAFQGLIAGQYTPATAGARSFGFVIS